MARRHLCLFDTGNPLDTFADRYPYPLFQYVQLPPKIGDRTWARDYDLAAFPLDEIITIFAPVEDDVLEVELLDRRVQFQGLQISVINPVEDIQLAPFTFSGAIFDLVDCSQISKHTYLPFGGKLDRSTDLTTTAFVLDVPDYIGLQIKGNGDISQLHIQTTVLYSPTFNGLGLNNRNKFAELIL